MDFTLPTTLSSKCDNCYTPMPHGAYRQVRLDQMYEVCSADCEIELIEKVTADLRSEEEELARAYAYEDALLGYES